MGIFFDMVTVINRCPIPLNVRFDGQDTTLPPGESQLPAIAVPYAKNQNPIMGSADPLNPSMSGVRFLIGVKGTRDNCELLSRDEWEAHCEAVSRMDLAELYDDVLLPKEHIEVRGRGKKTQARTRSETYMRGAQDVNLRAGE